jgi:protein-tyrosine phosphatase
MFEPSFRWVSEIEPYRVALMPRPRGGEWLGEEMAAWRQAGIGFVLSLLEPAEVRELELDAERSVCITEGIQFVSFPIPDRGTPVSSREFSVILTQLHSELLAGNAIAIHCRAGIGRTGLVAGCLLHLLRIPSKDIFPLLSRSRGLTVPDTPEQVAWVERYIRTLSR